MTTATTLAELPRLDDVPGRSGPSLRTERVRDRPRTATDARARPTAAVCDGARGRGSGTRGPEEES